MFYNNLVFVNIKSLNAKNETEALLRLSSNMIGNPSDETNFQHKSLLNNTQVPNLGETFVNEFINKSTLIKTELPY